MTRTIAGVLRGGTSSEYNLSLKTGAAILAALPEEEFETRDIFIDKTGLWHLRGTPSTPARALAQVDVVLNGLHGGVGEDGSVGRILERLAMPYAGSRPLQSSIAFNKIRTHEVLEARGVKMPRAMSFTMQNNLNTAEMANAVFAVIGPPYVVKPPTEGASQGIIFASTLRELPDAIGDIMDAYGSALVEEFVRGKEASVGIIERFRNQELYALPPAEVRLPEGARWLESHLHDSGLLQHNVPSHFSQEEKQALENTARAAHRALGLGHFSRADLIVTPRAVYVLEVNPNPGLYPSASFPLMLESVGSSVTEFLKHAIALART